MIIDSWMKIKDSATMKYVLGYSFTCHYVNPDGSYRMKSEKKDLPNPEDTCTFEDLNHATYFIKHFKKLKVKDLRRLSIAMGTYISPFDSSEFLTE